MLKAALHEEVAEAVDHQRIRLCNDGLYDLILLLRRADLELLLQEDGGLLIIVADDLVDNVFPVTAHVAVEQATIVHRFDGRNILRAVTYI